MSVTSNDCRLFVNSFSIVAHVQVGLTRTKVAAGAKAETEAIDMAIMAAVNFILIYWFEVGRDERI